MAGVVGVGSGSRKWRLFSCAGCAAIERYVPDPWSRRAIQEGKRYGDGGSVGAGFEAAFEAADEVLRMFQRQFKRASGASPGPSYRGRFVPACRLGPR